MTRRHRRPKPTTSAPAPTPSTPATCDRSCCSGAARFRVRLALCLGVEVPGVSDVSLTKAQVCDFNRRYGGIADEEARHFIVQARGLGLGGDA